MISQMVFLRNVTGIDFILLSFQIVIIPIFFAIVGHQQHLLGVCLLTMLFLLLQRRSLLEAHLFFLRLLELIFNLLQYLIDLLRNIQTQDDHKDDLANASQYYGRLGEVVVLAFDIHVELVGGVHHAVGFELRLDYENCVDVCV